MTAIAKRLKDLHTYVVAAPANAISCAERAGAADSYSYKTGYLQASLQHVESDLRYLLQDLAGEQLEEPPAGWELGDHAVECPACQTRFPLIRDAGNCPRCGGLVERNAVAGAETAPHETVSISGEDE